MSPPDIGGLAAWALAGFLVGGASFGSLRLTTILYVRGGLWRALALHAARIILVGAGLVVAARAGAWPLLAAGAGIVAARPVAVRLWGRAP